MSKGDFDVAVLYPSQYLKCEDLRGRTPTVTIAKIEKQSVPMTNGKKETKVVIHFAEAKKQWIVGKTNGLSLAILFGRDLAQTVGRKVTLTGDVTTYGREEKPCIRVLGSPEADPDRLDAYKRAWRGDRKRGTEFAARLKATSALVNMDRSAIPETVAREPDPEDVEESVAEDDDAFDLPAEPGSDG